MTSSVENLEGDAATQPAALPRASLGQRLRGLLQEHPEQPRPVWRRHSPVLALATPVASPSIPSGTGAVTPDSVQQEELAVVHAHSLSRKAS